jgi:hypothetical protein
MIRGANYITLVRFLLPPPLFKHPSMPETCQATAAKIQKSISKDDSVSPSDSVSVILRQSNRGIAATIPKSNTSKKAPKAKGKHTWLTMQNQSAAPAKQVPFKALPTRHPWLCGGPHACCVCGLHRLQVFSPCRSHWNSQMSTL